MNHDIIVIGGSAGAMQVILDMAGELPKGLPASIFVAVHTQPAHESHFPELLSKRGPLPATHPIHGEKILPSHIYVAPPDNQLLVRPGYMEVVRGPRENGHRPALDALFRTASAVYGSRVIGVVLSGYRDCGTAGMMSVKARGGIAVAQSPKSAIAAEMPERVIARVNVDYVAEPLELAGLLVRLVGTPAGPTPEVTAEVERVEGNGKGAPVDLVCPVCQGVLTEAQAGRVEQFRCHVGHTFSLASLVAEQGEEMERALWAAVRALEESSSLSLRMADRDTGGAASRFGEKARTQRSQADVIRHILLHGSMLTQEDEQKVQ